MANPSAAAGVAVANTLTGAPASSNTASSTTASSTAASSTASSSNVPKVTSADLNSKIKDLIRDTSDMTKVDALHKHIVDNTTEFSDSVILGEIKSLFKSITDKDTARDIIAELYNNKKNTLDQQDLFAELYSFI